MAECQAVLDSIRTIVQALHVTSRQAEQRLGVSSAQLFVLDQLADAPRSIGELAQLTFTHQSSVSGVVAKLRRTGLVDASRSANDGRKVSLTLTAKGRQMLAKSPSLPQQQILAALQRMPASRRRAIASMLSELVIESGLQKQLPSMFFEERPARPRTRKPL